MWERCKGTISIRFWQKNGHPGKLDIAEFEKKYPDISTYGLDNSLLNVFLEDGTILLQDDWNGYEYISEGKIYRCVYELINDDDWNVVGYYEV